MSSLSLCLSEVFGTMVLIMTILHTGKSGALQPLFVGLGLTVAVLMFGSHTGHFNPAVTFAMLLNKPGDVLNNNFPSIIVCQLLGAFLAIKASKHFVSPKP